MKASRYFISPNAAPEVLYPLIPLLLAFDNQVVVWQPYEDQIQAHLNVEWWMSALEHPDYRDKLHVMSAESKFSRYTGGGASGAIRKRIERDPERLIRTEVMKGHTYASSKRIWDEMSSARKDKLEERMVALAADALDTTKSLYVGMQEVAHQHKRTIYWAMFDSVLQDMAMVRFSGSNAPLLKSSRWGSYAAVVEAMTDRSTPTGDIADIDEICTCAERIMDDLERRPDADHVASLRSDAYAARRLAFVSGIDKISFSDFIDRKEAYRDEIANFKLLEPAIMSAPHLNGNFLKRVQQVQDRFTTYKRKASLISSLLSGVVSGSFLGSHHVSIAAALPAIGILMGAAKVSSDVFKLPPFEHMVEHAYSAAIERNSDFKFFLRDPEFWESLKDMDE